MTTLALKMNELAKQSKNYDDRIERMWGKLLYKIEAAAKSGELSIKNFDWNSIALDTFVPLVSIPILKERLQVNGFKLIIHPDEDPESYRSWLEISWENVTII